ncbi:MAG: M48 family peptidase [Bacteroidetes bacterium]|nr:MAG: M48 family peptidase [Bacteroidota bacterium]
MSKVSRAKLLNVTGRRNNEVVLPPKCIEYVVIHEMCHLVYPNHGKDFFKLQVEIMPDWERWKLKLEKTLI